MLSGNPYLKRALLFAFGLKLFYLLLGNLLPNGWNGIEHILDVFARNDSGWYNLISCEGYPTDPPAEWQQTPFAFFPLYPAIIALFRLPISWFTQNPDLIYVSASFLAHLTFTWFWVVTLFKWQESAGMGPRTVFIYSIFFQVFPYHFFYHMFYSEVLFSILFMWTLISVARNSHFSLAAAVALLTLCRPTGIVFSTGLGLWIIADCGWFSILKEKEKIKQILALLAAPGALLMWMVYLHFHCGDALAFSHTQSAWGHKYTWPWKTLIFDGAWYKEVISWYAIALVLMVILLLRRARLGEQLFVGINVMFPLMTGLIASYYRYFSAIPQVFIRLFAAIESRWKLAVVICFIINTLLYYVWVSVLSHEAWLTY